MVQDIQGEARILFATAIAGCIEIEFELKPASEKQNRLRIILPDKGPL